MKDIAAFTWFAFFSTFFPFHLFFCYQEYVHIQIQKLQCEAAAVPTREIENEQKHANTNEKKTDRIK